MKSMRREPRFVTEPIVDCILEMGMRPAGLTTMMDWVKSRAPDCLPDDYEERGWPSLFPHDLQREGGGALTHNELAVELTGRTCYNSFGLKAGRKSNREYIEHTQQGDVPHASILYHAKLSFFIAGVSRRVSHELIRNYVGADRDEEGSPSQQSTRYVENPGFYIVPPRILGSEQAELDSFQISMRQNYSDYLGYIDRARALHEGLHGTLPKGMDYKRILETASGYLSHSVETSWVWTTNPMALAKMFRERDHDQADAEFRRLARKWKALCLELAPNLFPQPWMRAA